MTGSADESAYEPFDRGRFAVGVTTIEARDADRDRVFPCEIWYPAAEPGVPGRDAAAEPGRFPLVAYSHQSGGDRRAASFLCTHLASHGYVVAALDHSEVVAPRPDLPTGERVATVIADRVPDIRFLLDVLLDASRWRSAAIPDPSAVGIVGHSFGGWTALAAPDTDRRIRAVVAMAPGGASRPLPGMIPATLDFAWGRDVPTLYLVADRDTMTPLPGMVELFDRTPASRRMIVLDRTDHLHFLDDAERVHEAVRAMTFPGEASWIPAAMPPIGDLCPGERAHRLIRGLALCHFDATLRHHRPAHDVLAAHSLVEVINTTD